MLLNPKEIMWSQLLQDSKKNSKQVCGEHIEVAAVFKQYPS